MCVFFKRIIIEVIQDLMLKPQDFEEIISLKVSILVILVKHSKLPFSQKVLIQWFPILLML